MERDDRLDQVCERVKKIREVLPPPTGNSRAAFFNPCNLWSLEIQSTYDQVIEHYEGIMTLVDQGLLRPAAALARNIHEASFRLEYLKRNENKLTDWFEWQISRDYYFIDDFLRYEKPANDSIEGALRAQQEELEDRVGGRPLKRGAPWKGTGDMTKDISKDMESGHDKRTRRLLFEYASKFVHIRAAPEPSPSYVVGGAQSGVLLVMTLAMQLCRDKKLTPTELSGEIDAIIMMCNKLRGIDGMDNEPR